MFLCYVDESERSERFSLGGIVATAPQVAQLIRELEVVRDELGSVHGFGVVPELHAYHIFQAKGPWAFAPRRVRIWVFDQVLTAVAQNATAVLFRSVHLPRLVERQARSDYDDTFSPEQVGFIHLLQRVDGIAASEMTHALVIADMRADGDRQREYFARYQRFGTPGVHRYTNLSRIVDTIHFAPSHHSLPLQAADIVTYVLSRRFISESDGQARVVMDRHWNLLKDSGKLHGVGTWP